MVVPTPSDAAITPNAPCARLSPEDLVHPCAFGTHREEGTGTIALVGDSHASHWRAALDYVTDDLRLSGISIAKSSCPYTMATRNLPLAVRRACARWRDEVRGWFIRHPEIHVVFVGEITSRHGIIGSKHNQFDAEADGYRDAWRALPESVEHIVVIRDTPHVPSTIPDCIRRALARRRP